MRSVIVVVALLLLASTAGAGISLYDDFNDNTWDNSKWTRTSTSLVTETGGTLQVNGSGGTQEAQSVATFTPMSPFSRFEIVEKFQSGNNKLFGLWSGSGFRFREDQNANYWIEAGTTFEDSGLPYGGISNGTLVRYRIDWAATSVTMSIDKGDDDVWEFSKTYNETVAGPLPFAFRDQPNPSVLQIDAVYVPEPVTAGLVSLGGLVIVARRRR